MKYRLYGITTEECFYKDGGWDMFDRIMADREIDIGSFNPDIYPVEQYNHTYVYKPYCCYTKLKFKEHTFWRTIEVESELKLEHKIKYCNEEYDIKKMQYDIVGECFNVFIDKVVETIEISKEDKEKFLEKVKIYNERIDKLNNVVKEKEKIEESESEIKQEDIEQKESLPLNTCEIDLSDPSLIRKIINRFKGENR